MYVAVVYSLCFSLMTVRLLILFSLPLCVVISDIALYSLYSALEQKFSRGTQKAEVHLHFISYSV